MNVEHLGQVFTRPDTVNHMISLRKNTGSVLEPSCGAGAFFHRIPGCVGIELDDKVCPSGALNMDFFDYPTTNKFDTIIGNPPYVRFSAIVPSTLEKLDMGMFDRRTNLCLFFIKKCIDHLNPGGELIFIVPREIIKVTSAKKLNEFIFRTGTITYYEELGDRKVFDDASPNCIIFRYVKGDMSHTTTIDGKDYVFGLSNGQFFWTESLDSKSILLGDIAMVKVGGVSGMDEIFVNEEHGNADFVYSGTRKTGMTRKMIYNTKCPWLDQYHDILIRRKIKHYTEDNWWMWGRDFYHSDDIRVYVNCKTRIKDPFFFSPATHYDGSVLAIFPKNQSISIPDFIRDLNGLDWESLGFVCDGRYLFSQRSLVNVPLPESFRKYQ